MVSMRPKKNISVDGKLMSNECRVTLELLPLRCFIYQVTLKFLRNFFSWKDDETLDKHTVQENVPIDVFF